MAGLEKVDFVVKPEDVGFGFSAVLAPGKIQQATKADHEVDSWEGRMAKLSTEYGQILSAKMKVAVLYTMLPKDLQEKVLDECAVNWDETPEAEAGVLFTKIKGHIKNIAKSRREMSGPKPIEVDRVADWREWPDGWYGEHSNQGETEEEHHDEKGGDEAYVQYIGKGGGKKGGKGFQGYCYVCGGFGHSQWDCYKGYGKGKGFSKDGGYGKGYGKDGYAGKAYGKGTGGGGKGGMRKACFGCGSTEHVIKDCPKNTNVQQVEEDVPEILFIGNVQNKEALVDGEDEEEVVNGRQVENSERTASVVCDFEDGKAKNRVQFVNSVIKEEDWASLGVGDIIVASAADESCWPVGQGDAFPTKESGRKMLLRTGNGGDMQHCGEEEVIFQVRRR